MTNPRYLLIALVPLFLLLGCSQPGFTVAECPGYKIVVNDQLRTFEQCVFGCPKGAILSQPDFGKYFCISATGSTFPTQ